MIPLLPMVALAFAAEPFPSFTVGAGAAQTVRVENSTVTAEVWLLPEGDATLEGVVPMVASIDGPSGGSAPGGLFKVALEDETSAPRLVITSTSSPSPGAYGVKLRLSRNGATRDVDVQITVPAATVQVSSPLVLEQTCPVLGGTCRVDGGAKVDLRETSGLSRLTDLSLTQFGSASIGGQPISGLIELESASTELEPGGTTTFTVTPRPSFPYGRATATVTVRANELASTVDLPVGVVTRLPRFWFALLIVLGAVGGFFTRVVKPFWLAIQRPRADAARVLAALADLRDHPDKALAKVEKEHTPRIEDALGKWGIERLAATVAEAENARVEATKDYERRLAEAATSVQDLTRDARRDWVLPGDAQQAMQSMRNALKEANVALAGGNAGQALAEADIATAERDNAGHLVKEWWAETKKALEDVGTLLSKRPEQLRQTRLLAVAALADPRFEEEGAHLFDAAHAAAQRVHELVDRARTGLLETIDALHSLGIKLSDDLRKPEPSQTEAETLTCLAAEAQGVREDLKKAIAGIQTQPSWQDGDLARAVKERQDGGVMGGGSERELSVVDVSTGVEPVPAAPDSGITATDAPSKPSTQRMGPDGYEPIWIFLLRAGMGSAVSIGVLVILGFATQWDGFYGTPANVLAILTWAYGSDLGIGMAFARVTGGK